MGKKVLFSKDWSTIKPSCFESKPIIKFYFMPKIRAIVVQSRIPRCPHDLSKICIKCQKLHINSTTRIYGVRIDWDTPTDLLTEKAITKVSDPQKRSWSPDTRWLSPIFSVVIICTKIVVAAINTCVNVVDAASEAVHWSARKNFPINKLGSVLEGAGLGTPPLPLKKLQIELTKEAVSIYHITRFNSGWHHIRMVFQ